jgi:hypothetical protein
MWGLQAIDEKGRSVTSAFSRREADCAPARTSEAACTLACREAAGVVSAEAGAASSPPLATVASEPGMMLAFRTTIALV